MKPQAARKAKRFNFKIFQTGLVKPRPIWNESKQPLALDLCAWSQTGLEKRSAGEEVLAQVVRMKILEVAEVQQRP